MYGGSARTVSFFDKDHTVSTWCLGLELILKRRQQFYTRRQQQPRQQETNAANECTVARPCQRSMDKLEAFRYTGEMQQELSTPARQQQQQQQHTSGLQLTDILQYTPATAKIEEEDSPNAKIVWKLPSSQTDLLAFHTEEVGESGSRAVLAQQRTVSADMLQPQQLQLPLARRSASCDAPRDDKERKRRRTHSSEDAISSRIGNLLCKAKSAFTPPLAIDEQQQQQKEGSSDAYGQIDLDEIAEINKMFAGTEQVLSPLPPPLHTKQKHLEIYPDLECDEADMDEIFAMPPKSQNSAEDFMQGLADEDLLGAFSEVWACLLLFAFPRLT